MDSHFALLEVALEEEKLHFAGAQFRTESELIERERVLSEERKTLIFGVSENEPLGRFL